MTHGVIEWSLMIWVFWYRNRKHHHGSCIRRESIRSNGTPGESNGVNFSQDGGNWNSRRWWSHRKEKSSHDGRESDPSFIFSFPYVKYGPRRTQKNELAGIDSRRSRLSQRKEYHKRLRWCRRQVVSKIDQTLSSLDLEHTSSRVRRGVLHDPRLPILARWNESKTKGRRSRLLLRDPSRHRKLYQRSFPVRWIYASRSRILWSREISRVGIL